MSAVNCFGDAAALRASYEADKSTQTHNSTEIQTLATFTKTALTSSSPHCLDIMTRSTLITLRTSSGYITGFRVEAKTLQI